jgi:hypothetical protein
LKKKCFRKKIVLTLKKATFFSRALLSLSFYFSCSSLTTAAAPRQLPSQTKKRKKRRTKKRKKRNPEKKN